MKDFVHLHVHSDYSLRYSTAKIGGLVEQAKDRDMKAIALADHDTLGGVPDLFSRASRCGIKPIPGCSLRLQEDPGFPPSGARLVFLAKDNDGYSNLCRLVTVAHRSSPGAPFITYEHLAEFSEGLFVLCSGWGAPVLRLLADGDHQQARRTAEYLATAMRRSDDLRLAVQHHDVHLPGGAEEDVNAAVADLAHTLGIGLVATSQVLYVQESDASVRNSLASWSERHGGEPLGHTADSTRFYLRRPMVMQSVLVNYPDAFDEAARIADACDVVLEPGHRAPMPPVLVEETPEEALRKKCDRGLRERFGTPPAADVRARLDRELSILVKHGQVEHILLIEDLVRWVRSAGIESLPTRGPAMGSLVLYALGVTDVNPLDQGLIFERWFPEPAKWRRSPYFGLLVDHARTGEIAEYLRYRYGDDSVALGREASLLSGGDAVRRAVAIVGDGESCVRTLALLAREEGRWFSRDWLSVRHSEWYQCLPKPEQGYVAELARLADGLENLVDGFAPSTSWWSSPCVIVGCSGLERLVPVETLADGKRVAQFSSFDTEELGFSVIRVAGLRILTVMKRTRELIAERHNINLDFSKVPLDDAETYGLFAAGDTSGVYGFSGPPLRSLLVAVSARSIEDLMLAHALERICDREPECGDELLRRVRGESVSEALHPLVEPIVSSTHAMYVYQEQLMHVWHHFSKLGYVWADQLRMAAWRHRREEVDASHETWLTAGRLNGHTVEVLEDVWAETVHAASFAVQRAHALGEALLGYRSAYLKAHYPSEFLRATYEVMGEDAWWMFDPDYILNHD